MDTYNYIPNRGKLFNEHLVYNSEQALEVRDEFYLFYVRATTDFMSPAFKRNIISNPPHNIIREGEVVNLIEEEYGPSVGGPSVGGYRPKLLIDNCRKKCTVPTFVKDDINSGNAKLVIDYSTEGYWDIDWGFLVDIFEVPEDRIIWLTSLHNHSAVTCKVEETHHVLSTNTTVAEVRWNPLWERIVWAMTREYWKEINEQLWLIEHSHIRKSKGILYNRRPHIHRISLLTQMKYHNQLDNMIWSWGGLLCDSETVITNENMEQEILDHDFGGYHSGNYFLDEEYRETYNEILRTPEHSDNEELSENKAQVMNFSHIYDTYYQVITETLYQQPGIFLSEKSYKPFMSCQPFVLSGQMGTINVLRLEGYDVYDKWINHEYDNIIEEKERMSVLMKEILRLNSLSQEQWTKMLKEMLPTIKKNLKHLIDSGDKKDVMTFDHSHTELQADYPVFDL